MCSGLNPTGGDRGGDGQPERGQHDTVQQEEQPVHIGHDVARRRAGIEFLANPHRELRHVGMQAQQQPGEHDRTPAPTGQAPGHGAERDDRRARRFHLCETLQPGTTPAFRRAARAHRTITTTASTADQRPASRARRESAARNTRRPAARRWPRSSAARASRCRCGLWSFRHGHFTVTVAASLVDRYCG